MAIPQTPSPLANIVSAKTYVAQWFSGATKEAQIQSAINAAASDGALYVFVTANMLPYNPSLVTFNSAVKMICEGSNPAVFDARAYGLAADGTTDDTAAANAVLIAGTGSTVQFPAGTITVTQLTGFAQTTIVGLGMGATVIKRKSGSITNGSSNNTGAVFFFNSATAGQVDPGTHLQTITLQNLTIDGNASGNPGVTNSNIGCHGFRANYSDKIIAVNVEFQNCLDSGAYLFGCSKSRFVGCLSHHNGNISVASSRNGYSITGPQDDATDRGKQDEHIFSACEAYNNTDEGWAVGRNGRIVISACIAHDNGDAGIEGDTGTATADTTNVPAGWAITGCHVYSNGLHGITIGNSNVQRITITGNTIEDCPGVGISVAETSGSLVTVAGNTVRNWGTSSNSLHGITINVGSGVDGCIITDNILNGGAGTLSTGIVLIAQASSRRVIIADNIVLAAGGGGISVTGSLTGRIADNLIDTTVSSSTRPLLISSGSLGAIADLTVEGNILLNGISDGALIRTNGTANITNLAFRYNYCRANGAFGVSISEAGGGVITGLVFTDNVLSGNTSGGLSGAPAAGFALKRNNKYTTGAATGQVALAAANPAATVNTAEIQAGDNVQLSRLGAGGTLGHLSIGAIVAGTSFTIVASGNLDTSTVFWELVH